MTTSSATLQSYAQSLAQVLRLRGMREEEIRRIVGDVVASRSDDPTAEFGPVDAYADEFPVTDPTHRGGGLWWFGFAAGVIWVVVAIGLMWAGVWSNAMPMVLAGGPFVGFIFLGGVASTIATSRRRRWQK